MPTLTTVRSAVKEFDFAEYESADTLKRRLGDFLAKREFSEWMKGLDTSVSFAKVNEAINAKSKEIEAHYGATVDSASNWRTNGNERFGNYQDRETNKRILIPSGFVEIDKSITGKVGGAFTKGDYIVFYGATKRGKSHLVRKATTLPAVRAGYRVLDLCLENERAEIEFMLDSMESADHGVSEINIEGAKVTGGFDRKKLAFGYLDPEQRTMYADWTGSFDESNDKYGDYLIKTFEDEDMDKVDIWKIKSLIQEHKPDMLLVDPIYLTTYPSSSDKTPGAGAQAMSRALRRLATQLGLVIVVTVQATLDDGAVDDEAEELKVPPLKDVKSSKALLEDGTITFGIDSNRQGKALVEIMLSRKGGAGAKIDLQFFPNYGICRSYDEAIRANMERIKATKLF
ncbi:DnaB helicase C-terminal domain-containing protein [Paenibacillus hexagrammi]|uniref:DnaB helicase C-terminal domain-containing protein n=1 Tax=Paenibacillus hexagrammi TaxID=2908839 RepID=A0ABY3SRA2_9BACL|nr:DnaB helicase C-terminal domain-containing protein [Paenibacillus sp. YPD9-1]UJF36593.1 DnaB helicase C-terminal domain-containing protein [Paenibacillus sp. YPD9-1]